MAFLGLDIPTVSSIVGVLVSSVGLIDKVTDTYLKFRGQESPVAKEHKAKIVAGSDGISLVRLEHGAEIQRVTYEELTKKLTPSDLSYVRALESSMNTHKTIWESAYPSLASEVNPVAKAKIQVQLDAVATDMEKDLKRILTFVENTGLYLDDHYIAVKDIATQHQQGA
jgi:DNA polymerase I-like protein with 3'-5' exonuclease and polymerase domains